MNQRNCDKMQCACTLVTVPNDPFMWWGSIPAIPPNGPSPPAPMGNWRGCTKMQYKKAEQLFLTRVGAITHTSAHTHTQDAQTDKAPHIWSTSAWRYRVYHGVHVVARVGWIWYEQIQDDNKDQRTRAWTVCVTTDTAYLQDLAWSGFQGALLLQVHPEITVGLNNMHSFFYQQSAVYVLTT